MKKILYIAPHLSTGGLPQYLVKKIELLKDEFEIHVIEYNNSTGGKFIIQLQKIKDLIGGRLYTLGEDKSEILEIVKKIKPDIIHCEEIPEYFMKYEDPKELYNPNRNYFLVETSHDSSMNTENKILFPEKFMFVLNWQIEQYKNIDNIPKVLIEYPIEYKERLDRNKTLKELDLDPSKKHILHVGLFTPRKNQAEFFEYARKLPEHEFHCLGNQVDNFKHYWEPLMKDKPSNVTWWDERKDVERFYGCMDLFLFTSRGSANDKETMPLVIREAISHKIPLAIYNLDVYLDYFDKFKEVTYLNFDNIHKNVLLIQNLLAEKPSIPDFSKFLKKTSKPKKEIIQSEEEAFIISTYPISDSITKTTKKCISSIKKLLPKIKIILTSHIPIPKELQKIVDYCVVDNKNIITKHTYYTSAYGDRGDFKYNINLKGEDNDVYHGPTCYTNYYNGTALANQLGFKKVFFLNYDYILKDSTYIEHISEKLNTHNSFFGQRKALEGMNLYTYFLGIKPDYLLKSLPKVETAEQYDKLMTTYGSESNGLENILYHIFKSDFTDLNIYLEDEKEWEEKIKQTFIHEDFSRCEYYTILPSNLPNYFSPLIQITNNTETKLIKYSVEKNGKEVINRDLNVDGKFVFWDLINYKLSDKFIIKFDVFDSKNQAFIENYTFNLDKNYFENKINNNGFFTWNGDTSRYIKPKIKLLHLVTEPKTNKKEIRSVKNVKEFCKYTGVTYDQRVNKIWTEIPPTDTCNRPTAVQEKPGFYKLAPGHYGCYLAHKNAICKEDNSEYDFILIFEGDVIIDSDFDELYNSFSRFVKISNEQDQDIIGFGNPWQSRNLNGPKIEDIHTDVTPFIPAQSYLITKNKLPKIVNLLNTTKWDAFDLWVCNVAQLKVGTAEKIYTKHIPGFSIVEQEIKKTDNHSPLIFLKE